MKKKIIKKLKKIIPDDVFSDLRKYYIAYKFKKGYYDQNEKELLIINKFVNYGDTVLDLGANIGSYTRVFSSLVGETGKVHSFEAIPNTYSYLTFNVNHNKLKNIVTYNIAVGDKCQICKLVLPDIGLNDIYQAQLQGISGVKGRQFCVPMATIDSMFNKYFDNLSFIKCDVEGAEFQVFKESQNLIEYCKPRILCEVSSKTGDLFFQLLHNNGYKSYYFDGEKVNFCKGFDAMNTNQNYLFIHEKDKIANSIINNINK